MYILNRAAIENLIEGVDLSSLIVKGFIAYSKGQVVVPPIGELTFKDPPGDVHIKYGYIKGDKYYVIKIASGFWKNEDWLMKVAEEGDEETWFKAKPASTGVRIRALKKIKGFAN